jgi:hypothetical protein
MYAWKGFAICPGRKEIPHAILESLRKDSIWNLQGYAIGLLAFNANAPSPQENTLFAEPDIYTYKFYDEFSIYSFYTGHYKYSQESVKLALKGSPKSEEDRILENITFIFAY